MEKLQCDVKSNKLVVGTCEYCVYESTQEAVDTLSEAKILDIINVQVKTRAMNEFRATATGSVSKTTIAKRLTSILTSCTQDDFMVLQGLLATAEQSEDFTELDAKLTEFENNA